MEYKTLILEKQAHIATITINRPKSLNAINSQLVGDFLAALDELEEDRALRVLIVTGGDAVFMAGADIKELSGLDRPTDAHGFIRNVHKLFKRLDAVEVPVIASVSGFAFGGGCELALACDYRLASETARFALPEVGLGLLPGAGGTQRLPRLIGVGRAMDMLISGKPISAKTAETFGLVNKVVSPDQLTAETQKIAESYARQPPVAVKLIKDAVMKGMQMQLPAALEYEARCFEMLFSTKDQKEGVAAFIEKRKPTFQGI